MRWEVRGEMWVVRWGEVRWGEERSAWKEYNWLREEDIWAADGVTLCLRWPWKLLSLSLMYASPRSILLCIYNEQHWDEPSNQKSNFLKANKISEYKVTSINLKFIRSLLSCYYLIVDISGEALCYSVFCPLPSPLSPLPSPSPSHLFWLRDFASSSSPHLPLLTLLTGERCNKQRNQQHSWKHGGMSSSWPGLIPSSISFLFFLLLLF